MMQEDFMLRRFIEAQSTMYQIALNEIKNERKVSHWMWYIFPQYDGLGRSETAKKYAIKSKDEAVAYYKHPVLGARLIEITTALSKIEGKSAFDILGSPDDIKLKSCMSLFHLVQDETGLFKLVLDKYFERKVSLRTIELLNK